MVSRRACGRVGGPAGPACTGRDGAWPGPTPPRSCPPGSGSPVKDDRVYLGHILRCVSRIEEYVAGGREVFSSSHLVQDAVLRNRQTMAESTQRLSEAAKERRPEVDWAALAGLRNV